MIWVRLLTPRNPRTLLRMIYKPEPHIFLLLKKTPHEYKKYCAKEIHKRKNLFLYLLTQRIKSVLIQICFNGNYSTNDSIHTF